jgi:hypothetical protein
MKARTDKMKRMKGRKIKISVGCYNFCSCAYRRYEFVRVRGKNLKLKIAVPFLFFIDLLEIISYHKVTTRRRDFGLA